MSGRDHEKSQSKIEIYFKSCVDLAIQRWKMRKKYTYLICIFSVEVETSINVKKCNISGLLQFGIYKTDSGANIRHFSDFVPFCHILAPRYTLLYRKTDFGANIRHFSD